MNVNCRINGAQNFKIDGLVQERRNSSALAIESRLLCTNPSKYINDLVQDLGQRITQPYVKPLMRQKKLISY